MTTLSLRIKINLTLKSVKKKKTLYYKQFKRKNLLYALKKFLNHKNIFKMLIIILLQPVSRVLNFSLKILIMEKIILNQTFLYLKNIYIQYLTWNIIQI